MQYEFRAFLIETLTNTHVGSGDVQYGVVDNMIQRDKTTSIPIFHASSLKGSLREHFGYLKGQDGIDDNLIRNIFGSEFKTGTEKDAEKKQSNTQPGKAIFCEARLLTMPLRATEHVYYHCSSAMVLIDYFQNNLEFVAEESGKEEIQIIINELEHLEIKGNFAVADGEAPKNLEIEDYGYDNDEENSRSLNFNNPDWISKHLGVSVENLALFNNDLFKELCENSIPVIARNKIGANGISENLFYEEVLPRRSQLYFLLGKGELKDNTLYNYFCDILIKHPVQFGADYSIGHGLCGIHQLPINKGVQDES